MDQALITSSIVLPMVHEFVQPLVLPAVPAVSLSRFRRAPSAVLGEFLLFFARSYMAMLAKVSDTSSGGVQAECRTIRTPLSLKSRLSSLPEHGIHSYAMTYRLFLVEASMCFCAMGNREANILGSCPAGGSATSLGCHPRR